MGVVQMLFHEPADLELDGPLSGDVYLFHGLGVLRDTSRAITQLEDAEIAALQPVTATELFNDLVKEMLNDPFDDNALVAGLLGNPINKIFLGYGSHLAPQNARRS